MPIYKIYLSFCVCKDKNFNTDIGNKYCSYFVTGSLFSGLYDT